MSDAGKAAKTKAILEKVKGDRGIVRLWPQLLAERDPDCLEHIHAMTMHALHERNSLSRKTKELILICLNAFDYYEYGFRVHVKSALKCGATEDEILEALEIVGVQKVHALTSMLPVLVEEVETFRKNPNETGDAGKAK